MITLIFLLTKYKAVKIGGILEFQQQELQEERGQPAMTAIQLLSGSSLARVETNKRQSLSSIFLLQESSST